MSIKFTFPGGIVHDEYALKATAAGAGKGGFSENEQEHKMTVPTGKMWLLLYGSVLIDVNAAINCKIMRSDDLDIALVLTEGASTGMKYFPEIPAAAAIPRPYAFILKAGDYLHFDYGANQDATAFVFARFLEVSV